MTAPKKARDHLFLFTDPSRPGHAWGACCWKEYEAGRFAGFDDPGPTRDYATASEAVCKREGWL